MKIIKILRDLSAAMKCKCPKCNVGNLFKKGLSTNLKSSCDHCNLNFKNHDLADGPAFFLIFILGIFIVPLAIFVDWQFSITLWQHGLLWTTLSFIVVLGAIKPMKSIMITLHYKYKPEDWVE